MKAANEVAITRALDKPDTKYRLFLLHGPDESGSRALAARLDRALGPDAERIDLDGATLKDDPARLADEAAAISLFGSARHIRVTGSEECLASVTALLKSTVTGDPVIVVAGVLRPTSVLLKLALASPAAITFASFRPEGATAEELAMSIGRSQGLRMGSQVAASLARGTGGDRLVLQQEIEKLALYLDAAPDRPREASVAEFEAIGAEIAEADTTQLVDAAFDGKPAVIVTELATLAQAGAPIFAVLRAMARRVLLLARLRAEVETGKSASAVMAGAGKSLFYKERDAVGRQLGKWPAQRLAVVATRLADAEQALKTTKSAGEVLIEHELVAIARVGASLR